MENRDYWLQVVSMLVSALVPILIAYGVLTAEDADLWVNLIMAVAAVIVPVVVSQAAQNWTKQQASVRVEEIRAGLR
jgi:hypothetical protein